MSTHIRAGEEAWRNVDLRALATTNVAGAVIGMALYTGALDARQAAREFGGAARTGT